MPLQKISYSKLLFSLDGRISRSTFWLKFYLPYIILIMICVLLDYTFGTLIEDVGIGLISGLVTLLFVYPGIAVTVKRIHDLGHSGLLCLFFLVPVINAFFSIYVYYFPGTKGPNKFGPDPLEEKRNENFEVTA